MTHVSREPWNTRFLEPFIPKYQGQVRALYRARFLEAIETGTIRIEQVTECRCGGRDLETLSTRDRFALDFGTVICRQCGLILTSPRMTEDSLPWYYEHIYHSLNYNLTSLADLKHLFKAHQGFAIFRRLSTTTFPDHVRILEVGSGTADNLEQLRVGFNTEGRSVELYGTEFSSGMIKQGRSKGIHMYDGGPEKPLEEGRRFDLIVLSHVLEHVVDIAPFLKQIRELLAPGGQVYIEVPGVLMLHERPEYDYDYLNYTIHAHIYNFCLNTLIQIVVPEGFRYVDGRETAWGLFEAGTGKDIPHTSYGQVRSWLEHHETVTRPLALACRDLQSELIRRDRKIESLTTSLDAETLRTKVASTRLTTRTSDRDFWKQQVREMRADEDASQVSLKQRMAGWLMLPFGAVGRLLSRLIPWR